MFVFLLSNCPIYSLGFSNVTCFFSGDVTLDLADRFFLSVDWKNNDKIAGYVLVQSKEMVRLSSACNCLVYALKMELSLKMHDFAWLSAQLGNIELLISQFLYGNNTCQSYHSNLSSFTHKNLKM